MAGLLSKTEVEGSTSLLHTPCTIDTFILFLYFLY